MSEYKPPVTGTVPMQFTEGQPVVIAGGVFNTDEAGQTRVSLSLTSMSSRLITNVAVMVFGWSEAGEVLCRVPYTYSTAMQEGDSCGEGIDIDLSAEGIARVTAFPMQVVYADGAIWYAGKGEVTAETVTAKTEEKDEEKKRRGLLILWISLGSVALIAIVILCVVLLRPVKRGTVTGTLVNASNPEQRISGATVVIDGQTCTTDRDGMFKAVVRLGTVRYTVTCADYITLNDSFEMTEDGQTLTIATSRVMASNEYRVVLTWGEYPSDLDSHLWGQRESGTTYHVYYPSGYISTDNGKARLEYDDTSSYGPETTHFIAYPGKTYTFTVHDYTNRDSSSTSALANSGAKVVVYCGNAMVATYRVPSRAGTEWKVFTVTDNMVWPVNTMSYCSTPDTVGK